MRLIFFFTPYFGIASFILPGVHSGLSVVGAALSVVHGGQVVGVEDPQNIKYWNSIGSKNAFEVINRNI